MVWNRSKEKRRWFTKETCPPAPCLLPHSVCVNSTYSPFLSSSSLTLTFPSSPAYSFSFPFIFWIVPAPQFCLLSAQEETFTRLVMT